MKQYGWIFLITMLINTSAAYSGEADVIAVDIQPEGNGRYRFRVTVSHADEGWDHYADQWEVLGPDGQILGTRTLHHPHVNEQPFTRSLSGVMVPDTIDAVTVRARDSVHGNGTETHPVTVPRE